MLAYEDYAAARRRIGYAIIRKVMKGGEQHAKQKQQAEINTIAVHGNSSAARSKPA